MCRFLVRFCLPVMVFIFFITLRNINIYAEDNTLIVGEWQDKNNTFSWKFTEGELGQRFLYQKDATRILGGWYISKGKDTLYLEQKTINGRAAKDKKIPLAERVDSTSNAVQNLSETIDGLENVVQQITQHLNLVAKDSATSLIPVDPLSDNDDVVTKRDLPPFFIIQKMSYDEAILVSEATTVRMFGKQPASATAQVLNNIIRGLIGVFSLLFIAFLFSRNRRAINWQLVATGIGLQIIFAFAIIKINVVYVIFKTISSFFVAVLEYSAEGAVFLFPGLVDDVSSLGFIFAFQVLPTVVFFSALSSVLYYLGILQKIVYAFAWVMSKVMKLSGAESLAAAANIFIGQTEAPLVVKPYLDSMSKSEIMCLMTGGMATIAGGVFAAYVGYLGGGDQAQQLRFATHLLSASIMSAPAAIVAAKILLPETSDTLNRNLNISNDKIGSNVLDAIANGTTDGLRLAVNVGAMLLVFIALMAMVNSILFDVIGKYTYLNDWIATASGGKYEGLKLQYVFGFLFAPLAWLLGVPNPDIVAVGQLLGEKTIINEFVAYATLGGLKSSGTLFEQKSIIIATYALCGFANFSSIGIQIGGIGALAPGQRRNLAELGVLSLIGGTVACLLTGAIAGMIVG